jgi:hypothetical protein
MQAVATAAHSPPSASATVFLTRAVNASQIDLNYMIMQIVCLLFCSCISIAQSLHRAANTSAPRSRLLTRTLPTLACEEAHFAT